MTLEGPCVDLGHDSGHDFAISRTRRSTFPERVREFLEVASRRPSSVSVKSGSSFASQKMNIQCKLVNFYREIRENVEPVR